VQSELYLLPCRPPSCCWRWPARPPPAASVRSVSPAARLTGGEPLLREDIVELVRELAAIPGIEDLCLTTNGTLLEEKAAALADAGLKRVNVSLDAVSPERFRRITGGEVAPVLRGIRAALAAGLRPVKLNCVVERSPDEPAAREVAALGRRWGLAVRFIRRMMPPEGIFYPVINGAGGRCHICNRVRLDARGYVRPCLFSDLAFSVRELGAEAALRAAILNKPPRGTVSSEPGLRVLGG